GADFDHYSRLIRAKAIEGAMAKRGLGEGYVRWEVDIGMPFSEIVSRFLAVEVSKRPTAMVVSYSIKALSLVNEFLRRGVRVPEDVSLATFDEHELVANALIPMTTVAVPMEEMGRVSAGLLLNALHREKGTSVKDSRVLEERLIARQSTGRPRQ